MGFHHCRSGSQARSEIHGPAALLRRCSKGSGGQGEGMGVGFRPRRVDGKDSSRTTWSEYEPWG